MTAKLKGHEFLEKNPAIVEKLAKSRTARAIPSFMRN